MVKLLVYNIFQPTHLMAYDIAGQPDMHGRHRNSPSFFCHCDLWTRIFRQATVTLAAKQNASLEATLYCTSEHASRCLVGMYVGIFIIETNTEKNRRNILAHNQP
jgi:hypothetical protein